MSPIEKKTLCLSIHDVSARTMAECQVLLQAVRSVADIPLTLLVVPRYHGCESNLGFERWLDQLQRQGHELALHGYTHQDQGPAPADWRGRFLRQLYTEREGEFAAIDAAQARHLLQLGLSWFRERDWPVRGFVAPAWLLGQGAWEALRESSFEYTTTMRRFHLLPGGPSLSAPSLVYTARNGIGRGVSRCLNSMMLPLLAARPLTRFSLHPRDARHPELLQHARRLTKKLLRDHAPSTKLAFARQWRMQLEQETVAAR
ncbi:hypothetical protein SAMN06265795_11311 [Noviherbaspirillum humi]|uniref:DUF2334 domain-containing protein n=1 Tax=Noviherbaspirillum humi TaxID=1688639 RepID=A0A239JMC8_9BURK|nr:polysaccharide deacetylase family protein [Noviherbaspirillum humi]SNT06970.1 hypothetical protein SAMN06265795_11311 [Noviherbaspirillum humi]